MHQGCLGGRFFLWFAMEGVSNSKGCRDVGLGVRWWWWGDELMMSGKVCTARCCGSRVGWGWSVGYSYESFRSSNSLERLTSDRRVFKLAIWQLIQATSTHRGFCRRRTLRIPRHLLTIIQWAELKCRFNRVQSSLIPTLAINYKWAILQNILFGSHMLDKQPFIQMLPHQSLIHYRNTQFTQLAHHMMTPMVCPMASMACSTLQVKCTLRCQLIANLPQWRDLL